MIYLLGFVVTVLAAARWTRAWNMDDVSASWRRKVIDRWGEHSKPGKLARCYWCAGFWISLTLTALIQTALCLWGVVPWLSLLLLPVTGPAVAYASSWLLDKEDQ